MGFLTNKETIPGLTEKTAEIYEEVSKMDCLKGLYLCGGTAQSLQMNHRLSEDLDFEVLGTKKERPRLDFQSIITEIRKTFPDNSIEILGDEHFLAYVNSGKVKLSFYRPEYAVPVLTTGYEHNNIKAPSLQELLGQKLYTINVRSEFRDYYDIYCLLKEGYSLEKGIAYAGAFSRHTVKSKSIYAKLLAPQLFANEKDMQRMNPKYIIGKNEIRNYISTQMIKESKATKNRIKGPNL